MKMKRFLQAIVKTVAVTCMAFALTACGGTKSNDITFEGEATLADGTIYNAQVVCNQDEDQTLLLTIDEMPNVSLTGHWVKVDGKGYKLYFDDADKSFSYTKYSTDTNDFTFFYELSLGGGYGKGKFEFSRNDKTFASEYDGEGLGNHPPLMIGGGWGSSAGNAWRETKLTCYEDGTCVSLCSYKGVTRKGTWTYDEANNVYSFEFEPENYTYLRSVGLWERPGLSEGVDFGTSETYRHWYWEGDFKTPEELKNATEGVGLSEVWVKEEGPRDFTTSVWHGESEPVEYTTTFDESTQTYTLVYEQYDSFFYTDRMVSYTLD